MRSLYGLLSFFRKFVAKFTQRMKVVTRHMEKVNGKEKESVDWGSAE